MDDLIISLAEKMDHMRWLDKGGIMPLPYKGSPIHGDIKRILIVQLSAIGDVALSIPTILGLRKRYRDAYISYLVEEAPSGLITNNPYLDDVFIFPRDDYMDRLGKGDHDVLKEIKEFIDSIKGFDWVLNLNPTPRSAYITGLLCARNTTGLTIDGDGRPYLSGCIWVLYKYVHFMTSNRFIEDGKRLSLAEINLRMAGVDKQKEGELIPLDDETMMKGEALLRDYGIREGDLLVGLNPGSNIEARRWREDRFSQLADLLVRDFSSKVIIFGGPMEMGLIEKIRNGMKEEAIIDVPKKRDLKRLAFLLKRCNLLITNDTGPMHIAGALGTPTIAICGPTRIGAYGKGHIQIQADLPCVGCGPISSCKKRDCMDAIQVDDVLGVLRFILGKTNSPPRRTGINIYRSLDPDEDLFSYIPIHGDGDLVEKMLGFVSLNLWIEENRRIGYTDEPIGLDVIKNRLLKEYGIKEIEDGAKEAIYELRRYERFLDDAFLNIEKRIRLGKGGILEILEDIHKMEIEDRAFRIFDFFNYIYQGKMDPVDVFIGLYQRKRSALYSMIKMLEGILG